VERDDTHRLGYRGVDEDPNAEVLLASMAETARWEATVRLRAWERAQLGLAPGDRLLDVGCGLGEAALALAEDLGETGEIVGVDASERMLDVARAGAAAARCRVRFTRGDATALDEPDDAFDAARTERLLQWLSDPAAAVAELVRVVRPGGRLSLIDTDWSTFEIDVGDPALAGLVRELMRVERHRSSTVGRPLGDLVAAAGATPIARTDATQTWTSWDPDASPAPLGCFSMASLVDDLVGNGLLEASQAQPALARIDGAARAGRFGMRLRMFGVIATVP
jgi:SAM-dependent methyltransferase